MILDVAGESRSGRQLMRCVERVGCGGRSCARTCRLLGQLPPRRVAREVARSLESSSG